MAKKGLQFFVLASIARASFCASFVAQALANFLHNECKFGTPRFRHSGLGGVLWFVES